MAKNSLALSDRLVQLLAAADTRNGLPAGTMFSVMQQEIGGQNQYLNDPTLPHYPSGVAPNGKKSSAFGPFGILESTGRNPGYGVAPLKDKSLEEQIRFASDYLAGRTRAAGGDLAKGLAGYGEGLKYAGEVTNRIGGGRGVVNPPVVVAQDSPVVAPVLADPRYEKPVEVRVAQYEPTKAATPTAAPVEDPWNALQRTVADGMAERFKPTDMQYGAAAPVKPQTPAVSTVPTGPADYLELLASDVSTRPEFGMFQGWANIGRRRS